MFKFEHAKYCNACEAKICIRRTHLPTHNIVLKPGYHFVLLLMSREPKECHSYSYDLKITEEAEYKARPFPHNGLDLIRNHSNDSMLSDRADFNFHHHDFELYDNIPFADTDTTPTIGVKVLTPRKMRSFIGDPVELFKLQERYLNTNKPHIEPGVYFNKIYRNEELIGYGINKYIYSYDVLNEVMHEDSCLHMAVAKYTDKESRKADGILFAGEQGANWMNHKEGIEELCSGCRRCDEINDRNHDYWA